MHVMSIIEQVTASINPTGKRGKPADVQNATWASSDESVCSVVPSEGGKSALIVAQGVGQAKVNVAADADLGDGVKLIFGSQDIQVVLGEAVTLGITMGVNEEQPEGEPEPPVDPPAEPPVDPPPPPPVERRR